MNKEWEGIFKKVDDYRWIIPTSFQSGMRVPGLIYADEEMLSHIIKDNTPKQVANVACLPGIVKHSLAMPDIHWGYGFSIGGVAATDPSKGGVISPGGVGSDINCGVRLLKTDLSFDEVKKRLEELVASIYNTVPCGVGSKGGIKLSDRKTENDVLFYGAKWAVERGHGVEEDLSFIEENGSMAGANPDAVSLRAKERGRSQVGTLGSGNHFLEIQIVEEVFDERTASIFGLQKGKITVMIHSGSRGLGHQVCEDYVRTMTRVLSKYKITLPDRQLACAPLESDEGRQYFGAMVSAANYAWANRQCIMALTRKAFERVYRTSWRRLGMDLVYDVAHNIAKMEDHKVNGETRKLCVHRKGATRAFPARHPEVPKKYRDVGQPVIVPGDMGTASYVLIGSELGMKETFGTVCHGAGRVMSRSAAIKAAKGRSLIQELKNQGIIVKSAEKETLAEEMPEAYKDVDAVVNVLCNAGIAKKVARMRPIGVVKG